MTNHTPNTRFSKFPEAMLPMALPSLSSALDELHVSVYRFCMLASRSWADAEGLYEDVCWTRRVAASCAGGFTWPSPPCL